MATQFQPLEGGSKLAPWQGLAAVYLPSFVAFVALDLIWITVLAKPMYERELADLPKADPPRSWAALASWLCIVALVYVFVLSLIPAVKPTRKEYLSAVSWGAVLGALLYGTVDFTNHAVILNWSALLTFVDLLWGTTACAVLAVVQTALRGIWV